MVCLKRMLILPAVVAAVLVSVSLFAKDPDFQMVELDSVSRYHEDRVAYQQIQKWVDPTKDDSVASLLIIRKGKMYLIKDGYDNPKDIADTRQKLLLDNFDYREEELWKNKMNSKPDYVRVTDRREELMRNFDEDYVSRNFGAVYIKARDQLLKEHVEMFRKLMRDRRESSLSIVRDVLPQDITKPKENTVKYYTSATAKSSEGWVYYAEDADGDGITETFSVNIPDNFNWGFKSGANVILVFKNKEKDVEGIIGTLVKDAYFGTPEEAKTIVDSFPKDYDIENIIKRK
jgi:hypothetical protein